MGPADAAVRKAAGIVLALALVACPPGTEAAHAAEAARDVGPRPDLVLVTLDTFRADRLAVHGGPPYLTPFLDALAETSTVFLEAVTPVGQTHPAHASLLTGLHPGSHGVQRNGHRLPGSATTLAELLRAEGYATGAFVQAGAMLGQSGLSQGFDAHVVADRFHSAAEVLEQATAWLDRRGRGRPLFLWLHFFETHTPYQPMPGSAALLKLRGGPLACGLPHTSFLRHGHSPDFPATAEVHDVLRILYDGHAAEADRLVRASLGALAGAGVLADAVVVVAADHGQLLGEHGVTGYGEKVWQEAIHVPLIVHLPRQGEARQVTTRVSLVDVVPTLAALLGLRTPAALDGRSLLPALRGEPLEEAVVLCGTPPAPPETPVTEDPDRVAALLDRFKVVLDRSGATAYDLASDPGEASPLPLDAVPEPTRSRLLQAARRHQLHERPGRRPPAHVK